MKTIDVTITGPDGEARTFPARSRKRKVAAKLRRGWKAFGVREEKGHEEASKQGDQAEFVELDDKVENAEMPKRKYAKRDTRELLRKKLRALVRAALTAGEKRAVDFANLKIVYELLLKDEAAELERQKLEGAFAMKAGPVVVTQEEMTVYVRQLLGKEITL